MKHGFVLSYGDDVTPDVITTMDRVLLKNFEQARIAHPEDLGAVLIEDVQFLDGDEMVAKKIFPEGAVLGSYVRGWYYSDED